MKGSQLHDLAQMVASIERDAAEPDSRPPLVSLVVPAYNEAENLAALVERVHDLGTRLSGDYELLLVDDGSTDTTWPLIVEAARADARVRGLRLSRNFGHQAALSAGLAHASGRTVCFLDADLQDPPELVEQMLDEWRAGHQVVYAVRRRRQGNLARRAAYRAFYRVYQRLADIDVPLDSGDFALLDRTVVDHILALPEHNRFLRGLRSWVGFSQVGVEYDRPDRNAGRTKYSVGRLTRLALDGILAFSTVPLRAASVLGLVASIAGAALVAFTVAARFVDTSTPPGWASIVSLQLVIGGLQLLVIGVLGEYVARVYDETKNRPNYIVADHTPVPEPDTA